MTHWSAEFKARYGFGGWDDPRPTSQCLHCRGTGKADEFNECGFCVADAPVQLSLFEGGEGSDD